MALEKVVYEDNVTVITAAQLNAIHRDARIIGVLRHILSDGGI